MATTPVAGVVLETSLLTQAKWPLLSKGIQIVAASAQWMNVPIFMPEVVELELAAVWERKFDEFAQAVSSSLQAFKQHAPAAALSVAHFPPDRAAMLKWYDERVEVLKQGLSLQTLPIPQLALRDVIRQSAYHEPPFLPEDKSFRDSLIALSLNIPDASTGCVLLGANDRYFQSDVFRRFAPYEHVEVHDSFGSLAERLKWASVKQISEKWQRYTEIVLEALERDLTGGGLDYIIVNLEVPTSAFGWLSTVIAMKSVEVKTILTVQIPPPSIEDPPEGEAVPFVAELLASIEADVQAFQMPPVPKLKFGAKLQEPTPTLQIDGYAGSRPMVETRTFEKTILLEGTIVLIPPGSPRYSGVRLKDQPWPPFGEA